MASLRNSDYPLPDRSLHQRNFDSSQTIDMATVEQQQPTDGNPNVVQQATQLEFTQAMQDFKVMFPDLDEDVIEAVLRSNQGAVDATIDQLLTMSTDNENERLRTEMDAADNAESPPSYSPTTPPPSYQQAVPGTSVTPPRSPAISTAAAAVDLLSSSPPPPPPPEEATVAEMIAVVKESPLRREPTPSPVQEPLLNTHNWNPPMLCPLPPDFLRINGPNNKSNHTREMTAVLCSEIIQQKLEENERQRRLGGADDPELLRYLEDERIALFLQNEEFMQELRRNKDFMSTLERDSQEKQNVSKNPQDSESDNTDDDTDKTSDDLMGAFPYTKTLPSEDSDAAFREKLKNMGKLSRRKFAQLARLFTRRKKRSAKQILSEGAVPSRDNLLLEDDDYLDDSGDETLDSKDDKVQHTNSLYSEKNVNSSP